MKRKIVLFTVLILSLLSCSTKKAITTDGLLSCVIVDRTLGSKTLIKGFVRAYDSRVVPDAEVISLGRGQGTKTFTDDGGYFELEVASGEVQLDIASRDYGVQRTKPFIIEAKETLELKLEFTFGRKEAEARANNKTIDETGEKVGSFADGLLKFWHFITTGEWLF